MAMSAQKAGLARPAAAARRAAVVARPARIAGARRAPAPALATATSVDAARFIPRWSAVRARRLQRSQSPLQRRGPARRDAARRMHSDTRRAHGQSASATGHCSAPAQYPPPPPFSTTQQCFEVLRDKRVETVSPEAAARLVESGDFVLIDVRKADQHANAAPAGAVNVPLYQKLEVMAGGFDATKVGRRGCTRSARGRAPARGSPGDRRAAGQQHAAGAAYGGRRAVQSAPAL